MTSGFMDDLEIEILCTKCNSKTKKSIRWIKSNNKFTCTCGAIISLNTGEIRAKIADVESAWRRIQDSLK